MTATLGRFLILASVLASTLAAMISFAAGRKHSPEGVRGRAFSTSPLRARGPLSRRSPGGPAAHGPNPLLQHLFPSDTPPPFLYLGYVGMTIPFGYACAALLRGRLGLSFLKPIRSSL